MSDVSGFLVVPVSTDDCREWLTKKHYLRRMTSFTYSFGLYQGAVLVGVCTFGNAIPVQMKKSICGESFAHLVYELNRLCTNDDLPRNAESFFLGRCFALLPKPMIIVSYADAGTGHVGYIYQATNFYYTGVSHIQKDWKLRGAEHRHSRSLMDEFAFTPNRVRLLKEKYGDALYQEERPPKHRYVRFLGDRRSVRKMEAARLFEPKPYPKGATTYTDASYTPEVQLALFQVNTKEAA